MVSQAQYICGGVVLVIIGCIVHFRADKGLFQNQHAFKVDDPVPLFASKIGPFANPSETYEYYNLPYCKPANGIKFKKLGLGEVVDANRWGTVSGRLQARPCLLQCHILHDTYKAHLSPAARRPSCARSSQKGAARPVAAFGSSSF